MTPEKIKFALDAVMPWVMIAAVFIAGINMFAKYASLPNPRARYQAHRRIPPRVSAKPIARPIARRKELKRRKRRVNFLAHLRVVNELVEDDMRYRKEQGAKRVDYGK